ncbi:hypothetical protein [Comamonas terrigena]|nr:hypothetical protein [Comamonas terrigena]BBL22682.1 hypothetical protein CT3_01370 [Comamonas terrigena NBRC 13299]
MVVDHAVCIDESDNSAIVSNLAAEHVAELQAICVALTWGAQLFDSAGELFEGEPDSNFEPFLLVIDKPASADSTVQLLTNRAFSKLLLEGHEASIWKVAQIECTLFTGTRVIAPWSVNHVAEIAEVTKSPRALVKEFGGERKVPEDVRPWLVKAQPENFDDPSTQVWVRASSIALIRCLPSEIDAETEALKFRGPPRLAIPEFDAEKDSLDPETYKTLVDAVTWVFENQREAEMRHVLLAAEIARSGSTIQSAGAFLKQNLADAWESAKIAYEMAVAETGRDTLKVLSDLRKAVTEETAKLSDMGRQLNAAVAAALATGIGLMAARVATNAPPLLIAVVMGVVAIYIATVIHSGVQFMRLQRQLREDWQQRLYRFLPETEYEKMVVKPTRHAETAFTWTAWLGGIAVVVLTVACVFWAFKNEVKTPDNTKETISEPSPHRDPQDLDQTRDGMSHNKPPTAVVPADSAGHPTDTFLAQPATGAAKTDAPMPTPPPLTEP